MKTKNQLINQYALRNPKILIECYHCGYNWKVDTRTFFLTDIFIVQCPKCKNKIEIKTSTANYLLYLP